MGFANFCRQFIKSFSKIAALFTSILKTTAPLAPTSLVYTKAKENKPGTDGDSGVSGGRIDDRMVNLSSSTKKKSSKTGFLLPKLV